MKSLINRLSSPTPAFWNKVAVFGGTLVAAGLSISQFELPLPEIIKTIGEYCIAFGGGIVFISRFATHEKTTMYQEQPEPRNTAFTNDGYPLEYFDWRNSPAEPWVKEVQYIEIDNTSPSGFWVYWRSFLSTSEFTTQTLAQFKTASFPRKPGKRGGTPPGQ